MDRVDAVGGCARGGRAPGARQFALSVDPRQAGARVSVRVADAVMRGMEMDATRRPQSATDFLALLETPFPVQATVPAPVRAKRPAPATPPCRQRCPRR